MTTEYIKKYLSLALISVHFFLSAQRENKTEFGLFFENQFMRLNGKANDFPVNGVLDSAYKFPDLVHTKWTVKQHFNIGVSQTFYLENGNIIRTTMYGGFSRLQIDAKVDYLTTYTYSRFLADNEYSNPNATLEDYNEFIKTLPHNKNIQFLSVPRLHLGGDVNFGRIFNSYKTYRPYFLLGIGFMNTTYRNFKIVSNEVPEMIISKQQLNNDYTASVLRFDLGLTMGTEIKGIKIYAGLNKSSSLVIYPNYKDYDEDISGTSKFIDGKIEDNSKPFKGATYFKIGIEKRIGLRPKKDEQPILNSSNNIDGLSKRKFKHIKLALRGALAFSNTGLVHNVNIYSFNYFNVGATEKIGIEHLYCSNYFEDNLVNPLLPGLTSTLRFNKLILRAGIDYHPLRLDQTFEYTTAQVLKDSNGEYVRDNSFSNPTFKTFQMSKKFLHIPVNLQMGVKVADIDGISEAFVFGGIGYNWLKRKSSFYSNRSEEIPAVANELSKLLDGNYQAPNDNKQYFINYDDFETPIYAYGGGTVQTAQPFLNEIPSRLEPVSSSRYNRDDSEVAYRTWSAGVYFSQRRWAYTFNVDAKMKRKNKSMIYFWSLTFGIEYSLFAR